MHTLSLQGCEAVWQMRDRGPHAPLKTVAAEAVTFTLAEADPESPSVCQHAHVEAVRRQPGQQRQGRPAVGQIAESKPTVQADTHLPCAAMGALRMLSWPPFSWEMMSAVFRGTATQSEERRVMGSLDTMATRVPSSLKRREYSPSPAGHRQVCRGVACSRPGCCRRWAGRQAAWRPRVTALRHVSPCWVGG